MPPTCCSSLKALSALRRADRGLPMQMTLSERSVSCLRFQDLEMLRGTSANTVLQASGRLFRDSAGSAATYDLSVPVSRLDAFISHNWSSPRRSKFMALALHFNLRAAFVVTLLACAVTVLLAVLGAFPLHDFRYGCSKKARKESLACQFVGCTLFLAVLFFKHEVCACIGLKGPMLFVDKTCIHQTDNSLKQRGISKLAAYLDKSDCMIIIYSDTYLRRLWTVYELASMLLLHPDRRLVVVPCSMPSMVLQMTLAVFIASSLQRLVNLEVIYQAALDAGIDMKAVGPFECLLVLVPAWLIVIRNMRRWAQERARIMQLTASFSINDAACFNESDRFTIHENIAAFMRDLKLVDEEMELIDVLRVFDGIVQREVPKALANSFGRVGMPYKYLVIPAVGYFFRLADMLAPCIRREPGTNWEDLGLFCLWATVKSCALLPLAMAGTYALLARSPERPLGWNAFTLCLAGQGLLFLGLCTGIWFLCRKYFWKAINLGYVWPFLGICASFVVLALLVYRPVRRPQVTRPGLSGRV